jgi:anaerobic magnesium-protoporphyrin IX monomethyl ester cyclase
MIIPNKQRRLPMKVFFCNPPTGSFLRDERCQIDINSRVAENMREPIQLLYLTGLVQSFGAEVFLRDYSFPRYKIEDVCADLAQFAPDWFYMETTQGTFSKDLAFIVALKERGFAFKVMLKAPFIDEEYLKTILLKAVFPKTITVYFITRDFEPVIKDILERGNDSVFFPAVFVWHHGDLIIPRDKGQDHVTDFALDDYPLPPRHFLNKYDYVRPDTGKPIAYIYTAKGCPYPCLFCSAPVYLGKTINMRSVKSVLVEIEDCVNGYGIHDFFFRSDTFTFKKEWVLDFCGEIEKRGLKISWGTNSRVDKIDEEMVRAMKSAGCDIIGFGIESGSDLILKKIKKEITTEQISVAHACVRSAGIKSFFHTIVGFPWDTHETIKETQKFLLKESPDFIEVNVPYPLRGTELYAIAKDNALFIADDLEAYSHVKPILRTFTLSPAEVDKYRKNMLKLFYYRPKYILNKLLLIKNPKVFINYVKWGLSFTFKLFRS